MRKQTNDALRSSDILPRRGRATKAEEITQSRLRASIFSLCTDCDCNRAACLGLGKLRTSIAANFVPNPLLPISSQSTSNSAPTATARRVECKLDDA